MVPSKAVLACQSHVPQYSCEIGAGRRISRLTLHSCQGSGHAQHARQGLTQLTLQTMRFQEQFCRQTRGASSDCPLLADEEQLRKGQCSDSRMEKFEQKMQAEGLSQAAIDAFRLNYEQLVAGVTGLVSKRAEM